MDDFSKETAYIRAQKKVQKLKGFYAHLASYVIVNIFLIILFGMESDNFWSFGTFATAFFWGIGLAFHAFQVFGMNFIFGKDWEEHKIRDFMEKEQQEIQKNKF